MTAEEFIRTKYGSIPMNRQITLNSCALMMKAFAEQQNKELIETLKLSTEECCTTYKKMILNENKELIEENEKLKLIIENGLGPKDLENDISPMHEI